MAADNETKPAATDPETPTITRMRSLREQTMKACATEVQAVLDRHGCTLAAIPVLVPDGAGFKLAAKIEMALLP
jgi:hypothetical protein